MTLTKRLSPAEEKAVLERDTQLNLNLEEFMRKVDIFQREIEEDVLKDRLRLKAKTLAEAIAEHPGWVVYYDQRRAELKTFLKRLEAEVERIRGVYFVRYSENHSVALGPHAIKEYINREANYNKALNVKFEIEGLYESYTAVCDAFTSRGFQLRDMTAARVAQVHNDVL